MHDIHKHLKVECFFNILLIFYDLIVREFAVFYLFRVDKCGEKVSDLFLGKDRIILDKEMIERLERDLLYLSIGIMINKFLIKILQIFTPHHLLNQFFHRNLQLTIDVFDVKYIGINQIANKLVIIKSVFKLFVYGVPKTMCDSNLGQTCLELNFIDEKLLLQIQRDEKVEYADSL